MPSTSTPSLRGEAGDGAEHRDPVVAVGVDRAAAQAAGALDAIPSGGRLDLAAERPQRRGHGRDPVGLLAAQLLGVADRRLALGEAGGEGDQRQLVDGERDLGAADLGAAAGGAERTRSAADRLAAASQPSTRPRSTAPIRWRIVSRPVRVGLRPTPSSVTSLPGNEQRGDEEEGGRGEVGRDGDLARLETLGRAAPSPRRRSRSTSAPAAASIRSLWSRLGAARRSASRPRRAGRRTAGTT